MKQILAIVALTIALPTWALAGKPARKPVHAKAHGPAHGGSKAKGANKASKMAVEKQTCATKAKTVAKAATKTATKTATTTATKTTATTKAIPVPALHFANEAARPAADDPDHEQVARLQESLEEIVRGKILGRLRVGMDVEDLATGHRLFGWRSGTLMDPASNQKVLATTTALLRLGGTFRYRTEVTGPEPDAEGKVAGDIVVRGNGDPSLRHRHIEALAEGLAARGVTKVAGAVLGDPRRIGSDEIAPGGRPPLRVGSVAIDVLVRPAERTGDRPLVSVRPASDAFVVVNQAETVAKGRSRIGVSVQRAGNHIQVVVSGKVSRARGPVAMQRSTPSHPLFAAILLRQALIQAGIAVGGNAGVYNGDDRAHISARKTIDGVALALSEPAGDSESPLLVPEATSHPKDHPTEILALHESEPLAVLLRRVNKDSDNEWAERVLETVGAEIYGGAPTTAKGVRALREALGDLDLPLPAYLASNGSGLGHQNRVTAAGIIALLRRLYLDPRIGPDLMQSLSVGGVDGTTRNRFRGTSAAHRVRAKTGTLNGVSCLSGFVGDGGQILAFSILVEGHSRRGVPSVRAAQVSAVNAMMRFAKGTAGALPPPIDESTPGNDFETGDESDENADENATDATEPGDQEHMPTSPASLQAR